MISLAWPCKAPILSSQVSSYSLSPAQEETYDSALLTYIYTQARERRRTNPTLLCSCPVSHPCTPCLEAEQAWDMGLGQFQCLGLVLVLLLLFCSGTEQRAEAEDAPHEPSQIQRSKHLIGASYDMPELDVSTPLATVPVVNPGAGTPGTPAAAMPATPMAPSVAAPAGGGQSWCVASPSASPTALQVALDYACGYGGADCSAIQPGGACFNPDTVRDHASVAFNSYYQKDPIPTSCDFGGTAVLTSTDPSTSTCRFPSTSTGASVLNTTAPPTTPTIYGPPSPPAFGSTSPPVYGSTSPPVYGSTSPPDYGDNNAAPPPRHRAASLPLVCCLLAAAVSLTLRK